MKKQEFITLCLTACLIIAFQSVQAQWGWGGTRGNGNVIEEKRKVGNFDRVSAASGLDVYITQGNGSSVVVETDENLQDLIKTEVEGNTLKLKVKGSISNAKVMKVHVRMPEVEGIYASGGSDIYGENKFSGDDLEINSSGGSDVRLVLDYRELACNTSGGSDAILEGRVGEARLVSSGGSDIKGKDLRVGRCKVNSSGGSDIYIHVDEHIEGNASGASDIHLYGNPSHQSVSTSGASDFHKM